jgi:predicted glutamine amidotransferase
MCRLLAYTGEPVYLDTLLLEPEASLVSQSLSAREAKTVVNGDGCGIGWYGARPEPGVYRGTLPAWSDANLASLCRSVEARLFLAHVRSATSGEVSFSNCHPFSAGKHLFMHNGQIGGYPAIRRSIEALIPDPVYSRRRGNSDSEAIFLAALGQDLEGDPARAISKTLEACHLLQSQQGVTDALRFTAILSDGNKLHAFRWASDDKPPSLYWRQMKGGIAVASEPFVSNETEWHAVPANCHMVIDKDVQLNDFTVERH